MIQSQFFGLRVLRGRESDEDRFQPRYALGLDESHYASDYVPLPHDSPSGGRGDRTAPSPPPLSHQKKEQMGRQANSSGRMRPSRTIAMGRPLAVWYSLV